MDLYGGYKMVFGDFGIDVGGIYYYYLGSDDFIGFIVKNGEVYIGVSWKFLFVKYYYVVIDYFSFKVLGNKDIDGMGYFDILGNYDLGNGWGVNGYIGYFDFKYVFDWSYIDWKFGVIKDVGGWVFGLVYVDFDVKGDCGKGEFYCFINSLDVNGIIGFKNMNVGCVIGILLVFKIF